MTSSQPSLSNDNPSSWQLEVQLEGLRCAPCVSTVEAQLNSLPRIQASVNLATHTASVVSDKPINLDQLTDAVELAGYKVLPQMSQRDSFDWKTWFALGLTVPVVLLSMIPPLQFEFFQWVIFVLTTFVVFVSGSQFHSTAFAQLKGWNFGMDALVSLGTLTAWLGSVIVLLFFDGGSMDMKFEFVLSRENSLDHLYFEAACVVTALVLLGRNLEARARRQASQALQNLLQAGSQFVFVYKNENLERIAIDQIEIGDVFQVRPGEQIASDGIIIKGSASVDQSLLTGESKPVILREKDRVVGGTINVDGNLMVKADRVGKDTLLAQIQNLMQQAQAQKASIQRLADQISSVFVPIVLLLSITTAIVWLLLGYPVVALTATIAILVVACPCALGLAVPTALVAACGRGSQLGLYFRNIQVIEKSGHIDTVVWDKTGTLTEGKMEVVEWFSEDPEILAQVGVLAEFSHHPVSKALAEYGQLQFGEDWSSWQKRYSVSDMQNLPGLGIKALVSGQEVTIGKRSLFEDQSLADNNLSFTDCSVVFAGRGGKIEAWGMIADTVRPSSYKAIQYLQKRKINNILLTGDNLATALKIAKQLGIDEVYADVLPEEKAQKIIELQNRHKTVAMVGDGINDAPALAQADLGINLGELELARQAADITILKADPWTVAEGFQLADRSRKIIRQNLAWAFSYNILLLPVASLGFLNPVWAGSAMALSSILVVTNSLRLRRFKLKGIST